MKRKLWDITPGYRRLHAYSRFITRSCFSSIRVENIEKLPDDGAIMLGPNHCAAMMDPMTILYATKRPVGFAARSDIFANPKIARFLNWLRILPIARERNGLQEVAKNYEIFDEIVDCMGHDLTFCLFSEGTHRAERGMLPVKKGIFRIARQALDQLDRKVRVVPMGLDYEYFFRGQGRAVIRFGDPIDVGAFFAARPDLADGDIYKELCAELRERDLALIGRIPERRHDRVALRCLVSVLLLPLFLLCAVGSILIWLPHTLIMASMEDKAWSHTVRFVLRAFLPVFIPFHMGFEGILNYWRNLFEDFQKH